MWGSPFGPRMLAMNGVTTCLDMAGPLDNILDNVPKYGVGINMAILQFAFGGDAGNGYLPHNHQTNCAVYPGTHDNDTTLGWYRRSDEKTRDHARRYLRVSGDDISWDFVRAAYQSVCRLALIPLQDLLGLDSDARFNTPGVASGNWQWRYRADQLESLRRNNAANLRGLAGLYGRTTATEYNHGLCEAAPRPFR